MDTRQIKINRTLKALGIFCFLFGLIGAITGSILENMDKSAIEIDSGKLVKIELKKVETKFEYYTDTVAQLWLEIDSKPKEYLTILPIFVEKHSELTNGDSVSIWSKLDGLHRGFYRICQLKKNNNIVMSFNDMIKSEGTSKKTVKTICEFLLFSGILLILLGFGVWSKLTNSRNNKKQEKK